MIVASRNVNGGRCWWNIANSHQIDCVEGPLNWPNNLVIELFRTNCVWILHGEGQNMCNRDGGEKAEGTERVIQKMSKEPPPPGAQFGEMN